MSTTAYFAEIRKANLGLTNTGLNSGVGLILEWSVKAEFYCTVP